MFDVSNAQSSPKSDPQGSSYTQVQKIVDLQPEPVQSVMFEAVKASGSSQIEVVVFAFDLELVIGDVVLIAAVQRVGMIVDLVPGSQSVMGSVMIAGLAFVESCRH